MFRAFFIELCNDFMYNKSMKNWNKIYDELKLLFPDAKCELDFFDDYSLLISVILSAQCTDKRVNQVTKILFQKYPTVKDLASANESDVQEIIHSVGMYKQKSKNLIITANKIIDDFGGKVPNNMEDLTSLAGVGRKTANVVLAVAFNKPAIAVDTHIFRLSHRLGLSSGKNPTQVEQDLMKILPKELWNDFHYLLVLFGRYHCKAIKPDCCDCKLKSICKEKKCR